MFISLAQCLLEWHCLSVLILLLLYIPLFRIPTSIYQIRIFGFSFLRVSPCPGFTIAINGTSTEWDAQVQIRESPSTSLSSSLPHNHDFIKSCWHFHHNTPQTWQLLAIFMVSRHFNLSSSLTWTTANSPILTTSFSWAPIIYSPKAKSYHATPSLRLKWLYLLAGIKPLVLALWVLHALVHVQHCQPFCHTSRPFSLLHPCSTHPRPTPPWGLSLEGRAFAWRAPLCQPNSS